MENTAGATQERKRNAYPSWFFLVSHSFFGFFLCSAYIFSCIGHVHLNVVHHFSLWTCCEVLWGQCRLSAKSYQIQKVPTCTTISRAGLLIVVQMGTYSHSELLKAQRKKCWVFLSDTFVIMLKQQFKNQTNRRFVNNQQILLFGAVGYIVFGVFNNMSVMVKL